MAAVDYCWVLYMRSVQKHRRLQAALSSSTLVLLSAVGVLSYTENIWYLVPAVVGAAVGTVVAMDVEKWRESRIPTAVARRKQCSNQSETST